MPRPIHFEIPSDDPTRAISFYQSVFGWSFHKWDGPMEYWLISTGQNEPGIDGGLLKRQHPAQPCVNTVAVADLEAALLTIEMAGGSTAVPKMPIPGIGWLAYCKDPDGNLFGIMQNDLAAH
jgi:predicted enzyme related to lactoylglutathione lyase